MRKVRPPLSMRGRHVCMLAGSKHDRHSNCREGMAKTVDIRKVD